MSFRPGPFLFVGALSLLLAGSLFSSLPVADASAQQPVEKTRCSETSSGFEVCTTNPGELPDGADTSIVRKFRQYVQSTTAGDTVRLAMYVWVLEGEFSDTEGLAQDLIDARARGVDAQVVMVESAANAPVIELFQQAGVPLALCRRNCLPDHNGEKVNVMHIKFLLVEHGDQVRVAHASTNLRSNQYAAKQNLLSVQGDHALYEHYLGFWNRMFVGSWTFEGETWEESDRERVGDVPGTTAYFFPRSDKDPVREELSRMSCAAGHSRVWVAATLFTDPGRLGVLQELERLEAADCDVRVLVTRDIDLDWVEANGDLPTGKVRLLPGNHNKLIVANVLYDGVAQSIVYAGSHNLNLGSLAMSSDGMLRVADPEVFDIYARYYLELFKESESPRRP